MRPNDAGEDVSSIEIVDECLVVNICIDRYLWALYQRAPKEDTIKVEEQMKVTVKKKGKTGVSPKASPGSSMRISRGRILRRQKRSDADDGLRDRRHGSRLQAEALSRASAAEEVGLSPGITSAFRDDYRQSLASGLRAATDRSYHGGSFRGGYGHGLAADVVSVKGGTRDQRWTSSEILWKWIDEHGKEFGIGRPYLDKDPAHVAPIDGKEYTDHHRGTKAQYAGSDMKKRNRQLCGTITMWRRP